MRKSFKKIISVLMALAILCSLAVPTALAATNELRIPISVKVPGKVAGVEMDFDYNTDGLKYKDWERSKEIKYAGSVDNSDEEQAKGHVKTGIFNVSNAYGPADGGMLDLGYLVFEGTGTEADVTLNSINYSTVIDKSTVENGVYNLPETVDLPLGSSDELVLASAGTAVVEMQGEAEVAPDAETLTYTVAVGNVVDMANAHVRVELDAAYMEEPEMEPINGFSMLQGSVKEENGKWICDAFVFIRAGMTADDAKGILAITAASKGVEGKATAEVTDALVTVYLSEEEGFEGYVDVDLSNASLTTEIKVPEKPVDPDPEEPDDGKPGRPIESGPSINGGAGTNEEKFPFDDVYRSDWYYDDVKDAWKNGLIDGVTGTKFMPNKNLTVAEAVKLAAVLYQMDNEGKVTLKNGSPNWYDTYVDYAVANKVIDAKYDKYTLAQMNAFVTREEFVYILHGAMDNYTVRNTVAANAIPDVKTGDFADDEIYDFYRAGICDGNDKNGTFLPKNLIKRSEVSAILTRMYNVDARVFVYLP